MGNRDGKKLKIGIICEAGFNTGTYEYQLRLAPELQKKGHDVTLITPFFIKGITSKQLILNSFLFRLPFGRPLWLLSLYFRLSKYQFDILQSSWYGMMNLLPWDRYKKTLKTTTLFDVAPDNKKFREGQKYLYLVAKILQPPHLRFNDYIITSTQHSKKEIMRVKGIPSKKIGVALLGVTDKYVRVTEKKKLRAVKKRFSLPEKFILNVGAVKRTRNTLGVVKAFALVAKRDPNTHMVFSGKLDQSGKANAYHKEIMRCIKNLDSRIRSRIHFLNYAVPFTDLPTLYSLSTLFLMPSLEEGFGLPLLEAMRNGCACVTSSTSCLPEIAGKSALLCNPEKPKEIATQTTRLLKEKTLQKKLSTMAVTRAKAFTWERTAKETLGFYKKEWRRKFNSDGKEKARE